jgi:toxin-antitoxin system PIN domain toxin
MIAVDTQILVFAHREDSPFHEAALGVLTELTEARAPWALPWPVVHEFLAIVTHPRLYRPSSTQDQAFGFVESVFASPSIRLLGEGPVHLETLKRLCSTGRIAGPVVHDARIAALCLDHKVKELWSADRDFSRFKGLRVRNPL